MGEGGGIVRGVGGGRRGGRGGVREIAVEVKEYRDEKHKLYARKMGSSSSSFLLFLRRMGRRGCEMESFAGMRTPLQSAAFYTGTLRLLCTATRRMQPPRSVRCRTETPDMHGTSRHADLY